ncbi:MAG: hypothetical protein KDA86_00790 [Planctomycetaceae bacterium]|nr:hypothetical protein [Planctomycetaceae bacterium]
MTSSAAIVVCALCCGAFGHATAFGDHYRDHCDSSRTSWETHVDETKVKVTEHARDFYERQAGTAAERVQLSAPLGDAAVALTHGVPRTPVHDDLTASVWVRANRSGAMISMRVVLPHQTDPRTGEPASFEVIGPTYRNTHRWEELTVSSTGDEVEKQMGLLRGRLANVLKDRTLDSRDAHVDRVTVYSPLGQGVTELLVDELQFGPLAQLSDEQETIQQIKATQEELLECPIRINPNELLIEGRPKVPRIAIYHGEDLDALAETGINVVWIERYDDQILLDQLAQRGMWAMAAPPQLPVGPDGNLLSPDRSGLMPIPASTAPILFWTVGTRIPPDQLREVENWISLVRDADRAFTRPRPVLADVVSQERAFSRHISLIGNSRHMLHTTFVPSQYRDYLSYKKNLALPDRLGFTWLQTEAATPNQSTRQDSRHEPIVVEAEQIWLQAYTSLSVGHRALGFWTTGRLDEKTPSAEERRLAISLLNLQADLLEPMLATGRVVDSVPVEIGVKDDSAGRSRGLRSGLIPLAKDASSETDRPDVRAAVIQNKYGSLVLPLWYDNQAQFQPGQMAGKDVRLVVPGGGQHAFAWSVTTTSVQPLELEYPAGGMEIRLPMLDQYAFIVITGDPDFGVKLTQRMRSQRERAAQLWVELARLRLERVRTTHEQLDQLARTKVPDAETRLTQATQWVEHASAQLQAENPQYDEARRSSRLAMQLLRMLQHAHWENAVAGMTSPTSSPHTICFSTLPDHWRMVNAIGSGSGWSGENLLRSGDFEDLDTVIADDWKCVFDTTQDRAVELHTDAAQGRMGLRIVSRSDPQEPVVDIPMTPNVSVVSPAVPIQGGQIVLISGQVRIEKQVSGHPDGLMIYDNVKGTVGALRFWRESPRGKWEPFRIIREVPHSRDIQLTIELNGDGDVRLDDVRVVALSPPRLAGGTRPSDPEKNPRRNLLDFTPSLPKVPFWNGRKSKDSNDATE